MLPQGNDEEWPVAEYDCWPTVVRQTTSESRACALVVNTRSLRAIWAERGCLSCPKRPSGAPLMTTIAGVLAVPREVPVSPRAARRRTGRGRVPGVGPLRPAPTMVRKLPRRGSPACLIVSLVAKLSISPNVGGQEIETFDCNDLCLGSAVCHRLCQSTTIADRG